MQVTMTKGCRGNLCKISDAAVCMASNRLGITALITYDLDL